MNSLSYHCKHFFLLLAACFLLLGGSVSHCLGADAHARISAIAVQELAVMPFLRGDTETQQREKKLEKNLDCQLNGLCAIEEDVFAGAEKTVTMLAYSEIVKRYGDKVVPMDLVISNYDEMQKDPTDTPREIAVRLGQGLGADHIFIGLVWRFKERVGSTMGATEPASVAFSFFIVDVDTRKVVWKGSFDKTQTSLSENIFDTPMFLQKGMKWLSAEELSSYGIQKILKQLSLH